VPYIWQVQQVLDPCHNGLLPDNASFWAKMAELYDAITGALAERGESGKAA
jgi:hypothetical protein